MLASEAARQAASLCGLYVLSISVHTCHVKCLQQASTIVVFMFLKLNKLPENYTLWQYYVVFLHGLPFFLFLCSFLAISAFIRAPGPILQDIDDGIKLGILYCTLKIN